MDVEKGAVVIPVVDDKEEDEGIGGEEEELAGSPNKSGSNLAMLTKKSELEKLALLLRNNEEQLMRRVFNSEQERAEYIGTVANAYRASVALLEDCTALLDGGLKDGGDLKDAAVAKVAKQARADVHDYTIYGLNLCMQNVRNCCMRVDVLGKLRQHYDALADRLAHDPDPAAVAAEAADFKASMWEYCYTHRSAAARAKSRDYSARLRREGVGLPELLRRHQIRLGYSGGTTFENLKDTQKLEVYNSVIDESGRAKMPQELLQLLQGRNGRKGRTLAEAVSVFIMAAGNLVYDIFTTEHNVETILKGSLNAMAAVGAFGVEVAVTAAVSKAVASVGAGLFACSLAGFVVGAIAGLLFIVVSGRLIDLIIGSPNKVPPVQDLKFHTAVMPDGMTLAREIARL